MQLLPPIHPYIRPHHSCSCPIEERVQLTTLLLYHQQTVRYTTIESVQYKQYITLHTTHLPNQSTLPTPLPLRKPRCGCSILLSCIPHMWTQPILPPQWTEISFPSHSVRTLFRPFPCSTPTHTPRKIKHFSHPAPSRRFLQTDV